MPFCKECGQKLIRSPDGSSSDTVADLQCEMAQVEDLMERLAQKRTQIRRKINSLSPISRLPPEILTEIFFNACHPVMSSTTAHIDVSPSPSLSSSSSSALPDTPIQIPPSVTPLFLGSICTAWRSLAWSTPLLWRTVTIDVAHARQTAQLELLSEWLLRAGSLPLHIKLTTTDEQESIFYAIRAVMDVLLRRSMYWGTIESLLPPQCHDILANNNFPILTSVFFKPPKGTISTFSQPPDMFQKTPMLSDVDLTGYDFSSMVLPWSQLRKFRTQFLTVGECLKVLRRCPNLIQCYLDNVYSPDTPSSSRQAHQQLRHNTLETLEVTLIKGAATSLFDAISLPSLRELALYYVGTEHVPLVPVVSLILRSPTCALRKLSVSRSHLAEDELMRCLEALPSLEEVNLCMREVREVVPTTLFGGGGTGGGAHGRLGLSGVFVRRLYPSSGSNNTSAGASCAFLPRLERFSYEGVVSCSIGVLLDMLDWRWHQTRSNYPPHDAAVIDMGGVTQLKSITILSRKRLAMDVMDLERLDHLIKQGMEIVIRQGVVTTKMLWL